MSIATTYEVPRAEWVPFFNALSVNHQRWMTTVEILGSDIGAQVEGRSMRFDAINADLKDREDCITIEFGDETDGKLVHTIAHPVSVWMGESASDIGTFEAVSIESADGLKTLVRFLAGALPEDY